MNYEKLLDYAKSYYEFVFRKKENYIKKIYVTFMSFMLFLSLIMSIIIFLYFLGEIRNDSPYHSSINALLIAILFMMFASFIFFYFIVRDKSTGLMNPETVIKNQMFVSPQDIIKRYPNVALDSMNLDEKSCLELIHEYDKKSQFVNLMLEDVNKLYNGLFMLLSITMILTITLLILIL